MRECECGWVYFCYKSHRSKLSKLKCIPGFVREHISLYTLVICAYLLAYKFLPLRIGTARLYRPHTSQKGRNRNSCSHFFSNPFFSQKNNSVVKLPLGEINLNGVCVYVLSKLF